jgi:O-methyltransferase
MSNYLENEIRDLYLDLVKKSLMHSIWHEKELKESEIMRRMRQIAPSIFGHSFGNTEEKLQGKVWPLYAQTMIGLPRLNNIQYCVETVINDGVEGDLIETGVWRGGACIFMRAILKSYGVKNRTVWAADSFEGLPPPDLSKAPKDKGDKHHKYKQLAVSIEEVRENFQLYEMLDEQVQFLKGWFKDTLPTAPIEKLSVCRLDGDMYESTMDAMISLYPKLSNGGFLIVDDYGAVEGCKNAIHDYLDAHSINVKINKIDWSGVFWRKE